MISYEYTGNWSNDDIVDTYYPGDLIHSWAGSANIGKAVFKPLEEENNWINLTSPTGNNLNNEINLTHSPYW